MVEKGLSIVFHCRCIISKPPDPVVNIREKDTEKRTEHVEEGVGKVGHGGDAKDPGLGGSAGVPGDQHRGEGAPVFQCAAEHFRFQSPFFVRISEHPARDHDGNVLVRCSDVEEDAGENGGEHQRSCVTGPLDHGAGDLDQQSGRFHGAPEYHGGQDQPDGVEHTPHATAGKQFVDHTMGGVNGNVPEDGLHH